MNENNNKTDLTNSKSLFVLKIITMSFAILTCVIVATVLLTRWITDLNRKIKESNTKMAKASSRLDKFRKDRIKHILRQRKLQLKEEKEEKKQKKHAQNKRLVDGEIEDIEDIYDDGDDLETELGDILLEELEEI